MSSMDEKSPEEGLEPPQDISNGDIKHNYKSYKKKYNKMRHNFKEKMKVSNSLFDEEQRAIKVARRLQEQNDQLLDLLLDVNESAGISPHLRYDLRSPTPSESAVPGLEPDVASRKTMDLGSARAALEEAKHELSTGQITPHSYRQLESALNEALHKPLSLSQLSSTSHTVLEDVPEDDLPHDIGESSPAGYLSLEHEEEYLAILDATLEGPGSRHTGSADSHPIRSNDRDKDVALRNPVSVYNWLRKHQPQVFLQDSDSPPDRPSTRPSNASKTPRRSTVVPKPDPEVLDDEGFLLNASLEGMSRSKRKREDEPYRPKGGSSRAYKRKKTGSGQGDRKEVGEDE
ncbi:hypothetical protein MMC26_004393 [Xylographa opegraphella]|nr:hypothetical protein [Xylographa opegraphella]